MRSSRSVLAGLGLALAACAAEPAPPSGDAPPEACASSILTYDNFGEPFLLDWCTGCHSSVLTTEDQRGGAPPGVDFDDLEMVRAHAPRIHVRATGAAAAPTMPPAAGPSAEERALLAEWLGCGAP